MKVSSDIVKIIFLCFIMAFGSLVFSQKEEIIEEEEFETEVTTEKQVISITELDSIMKSGDIEVIISDYEIVSTDDDNDFLIDKIFFSLYQISSDNSSVKKLYFYNCKFNLNNFAPLVFKGWEITRLNLIGCEIISPISFDNMLSTEKQRFLIENCTFERELIFTSNQLEDGSITFKNNEFNANMFINAAFDNLIIDNCRFIAHGEKFTSMDSETTYYQLTIGDKYINNIEITSSTFDNNNLDNVYSINFESASIGVLSMISNKLKTINLTSAEVEKALLIDSLTVDDYIGILNFDFPEKNTNASWYNMEGEKFAIFYTEESGLVIPYQAKTNTQLANNLKYNDLISAYSKFNTLYHDRGDIASANSSYVEIKDIETRKQAYVQTVNPTFNNLINYKLNVFLRFFSDYATNPGKSIIQSLWVLLIFTFLYMISFSRWDGMNFKYLVRQFKIFLDYITSNESIANIIAKEEHQKDNDVKDLLELLEKNENEGKKTPRILKIFGDPLIFIGNFKHELIPNLIGFFNFQAKSWSDFKKVNEKIWRGFIILLISIVFILYVLVVKFTNSLIMSINSFVVIGYGSLPETNEKFAMYLSIIEGVIGWFLLTIFTITLLSQVLQSV